MAAGPRIVVHAGFHKTGTSSVQDMLAAHRALLAPALRIVLKGDFEPVTEAARAFSHSRDAADRGLLLYEAARFFETLAAEDLRPVLISSEDLAGHMPFRRGLTSYDAAPRLMVLLREALLTVHPGADLAFHFSTRAAEPWVKSCYAQHLHATRMTQDFDHYRARALPLADLDGEVDRITAALAPLPVHRIALEDCRTLPLGPLDPLLDLVALPAALRAQIAPLPPSNTALPPAAQAALLALNRSDADGDTLRRRKKRVIRQARQDG